MRVYQVRNHVIPTSQLRGVVNNTTLQSLIQCLQVNDAGDGGFTSECLRDDQNVVPHLDRYDGYYILLKFM